MVLNVEAVGQSICIVESKNKKLNKKIISITDKEDEIMHPFNEFKTSTDDYLQEIYDKKTERKINFITGCSGSGKSVYASNLALQYRRQYPSNDIYLFSTVKEDKVLDKIKGLMRIDLNKLLEDNDIKVEDFKDSLCIFDDIDSVPNKAIYKKVMSLFNEIAQIGRHLGICCIFTSHLACDGAKTRIILAEAHAVTIFLKTMQGRSRDYLLQKYIGLDKAQIEKLKNIKSRHCTWIKSYPQCILTEKEVFVL
jgi:hypothetical protein